MKKQFLIVLTLSVLSFSTHTMWITQRDTRENICRELPLVLLQKAMKGDREAFAHVSKFMFQETTGNYTLHSHERAIQLWRNCEDSSPDTAKFLYQKIVPRDDSMLPRVLHASIIERFKMTNPDLFPSPLVHSERKKYCDFINHYAGYGMRPFDLEFTLQQLNAAWNKDEQETTVFDQLKPALGLVLNLVASKAYGSREHSLMHPLLTSNSLFRRSLLKWAIVRGVFNPDVQYTCATAHVGRGYGFYVEAKHFIHLAHQAGDLEVVAASIDVVKKKNPERGTLFEQAYLPGRHMAALMSSLTVQVPTTNLLDAAGEESE